VKREDIAKRLGIGVASVYRVLASTTPSSPRRDALIEALAKNPQFKVLPRSGKGFILPAKG